MSVCTKCGKNFPRTKEFFYGDKQKKDGLRPDCKICGNAKAHEYNHSVDGKLVHKKACAKYDKTTKGKLSAWRSQLKQKYGITPEDYNLLHEKQNGLCLICNRPETICWVGKKKILCVDHNHVTGKVRGLLCDRCNKAVGFLEDDIELLRKAIRYLEDK